MNINQADLAWLQPGKYLNDTLVEFKLKYVIPSLVMVTSIEK